MNFKLIREDPQVIHDFAHKMFWGHNIEGSGSTPYHYAELETQEVDWTVFHFMPLFRGDFIKRNMESGRVGIYEIHSVSRMRGVSDAYYIKARFCGYMSKDGKTVQIFKGYGVEKSPVTLTRKIPFNWVVIAGLTLLALCLVWLYYSL